MWRFISVTFAFLGYAFYTLSGGSDYAPRTQSIQARAKIDHVRPIPRPVRVNVIQLANSGLPKAGTQAKAITSLADLDLSNGNRPARERCRRAPTEKQRNEKGHNDTANHGRSGNRLHGRGIV